MDETKQITETEADENMRKEVKKEFQNAFIDLKAEMNFDRAKG